MQSMNWETKLAALNALCEHSLCMRSPGDWYVSSMADIGGDGFLTSLVGNGGSPQEAIERYWKTACENLPPEKYLVVNGNGIDNEAYFRWNGFMWDKATHMNKTSEKGPIE